MKIYHGLAGLGILLLLFLLTGCGSDDGQAYDLQVSPYGTTLIGEADYYHTHVYRYGQDRDDYERNEFNGYGGEHGYSGDRSQGGYRAGDQGHGDNGDRGRDPSGDDLALTGHHVRSTTGTVLDQFTLSLHNVTYQLNPLHVTSVGYTTFTAQTADSNINTLLNQRTHTGNIGVRNIHLAISPQQALLTATITMNNHDMNAVSTGTLQPAGGTRVIFVPATFNVNNVPLAAPAQQDILNQLNPVMDLSGLKCSPQIQQVKLGQGVVMLAGAATPHNLP